MDELTNEQKLRLTFSFKTRALCSETGDPLGVTFKDEALHKIGETAYTVTCNFARDLELFARHAKRSKIHSEDVKLLVRKNPAVAKTVAQMANALAAAKPKAATKRRSNNKDDLAAEPVIKQPMPGPSWQLDDSEDFVEQ